MLWDQYRRRNEVIHSVLRAVLDVHADHPALAEPVAEQARLLRWATGLDLADMTAGRRRDTAYAAHATRAAQAGVPELVG
ncbi:MAG: hypothetical protein ACRDPT_10240 [Streptomycetales bacterium]